MPSTAIGNHTGKADTQQSIGEQLIERRPGCQMLCISTSMAKVFGSQALEAYDSTLTVLQAMAMEYRKNEFLPSIIEIFPGMGPEGCCFYFSL
ncbi:hypothetical protein SUGI_0142110 [Cryptomeria japonica]|nr:hypothetical protein SUGI_0142110 [Cryptomeria japonica]